MFPLKKIFVFIHNTVKCSLNIWLNHKLEAEVLHEKLFVNSVYGLLTFQLQFHIKLIYVFRKIENERDTIIS